MTASPTRLVGTSWKMNKTLAEAREYVDTLVALGTPATVQPFLLPPHTALAAVRDRLPAGSPLLLGAQNAHWAAEGASTGEISMRMAADAGATIIEIGHSERRAAFGETDETVARKVVAALDHGLVPLVCVGEPREVRRRGEAEPFVTEQVAAALSSVSPSRVGDVWFAYEPVWAIGAGADPATPEQVSPVVAAVRAELARRAGAPVGTVLYGGSVDRGNARTLLDRTGVDGLFVGRAAWTAEGFVELLRLCAHDERLSDSSPSAPGRSLAPADVTVDSVRS